MQEIAIKKVSTSLVAACAALTLVFVALLAPTAANAEFTRKFERQISRAASPVTTPCTEAEAKEPSTSCLNPAGLAVNSADDLWVGNANGKVLDELEPAYPPGESKPGPLAPFKVGAEPFSVAVESATFGNGDIYVANPSGDQDPVEVYEPNGTPVETWRNFERPNVAVDNSSLRCVLSQCTVYVAEGNGVFKLSSKGVEEPFECKSASCAKYVKGGAITGLPEGVSLNGYASCDTISHKENDPPSGVAVDAQGDIYVAMPRCKSVLEYRASGEYVRAFELKSAEVPSIPNGAGNKGEINGLAVDPVSGHLLVSVETSLPEQGNVGAVDEFETGSGKFVDQLTVDGAGRALEAPGQVAVDSRGYMYLADKEERVVDLWGPGAYYPTIALSATSERTGTSAVLNGSVNPEQASNEHKAPITACSFQYVAEAVYLQAVAKKEEEGFPKAKGAAEAQCVPDAAELQKAVEKEEKTYPVRAAAGVLTAGVTYRYRLVATTQEGLVTKGGTAHTEALAFTAPAAPGVGPSTAENLSSTFADLHAQINPHGENTSYFFEYGPTTAYGQDAPVLTAHAPDGEAIGAGGPTGGAGESVLQQIGPLTPGSTYHFRVVAKNEAGVEPGPDTTFTTLPEVVPGLPDHRAYELVTPAHREGGSDMFAQPEANGTFKNNLSVGTPSESGDGFLLEAFSLFGPFPGAVQASYVFQRDLAKGEWTYTALAEPALGSQSPTRVVFDPADLSRVGVNDSVGSWFGEAGERAYSLLGPPGGPYTTLHVDPATHLPPGQRFQPVETQIVGGSHDLRRVVLQSPSNSACPGPEDIAAKITHGEVLCESSGGELQLVNVNDESEPVSPCGAKLGSPVQGGSHQAVSADGSKVLFVAPDPLAYEQGPGCWNRLKEEKGAKPLDPPQLYARIDATSTLEISVPEEGVEEEKHAPVLYPTEFVGASEDGSRVFFATETWLTENHPAGHDLELYEWRAEGAAGAGGACAQPAGCLTRASLAATGATEGAQLFGVKAVAAEGSAVYFLAFGALAEGAPKLAVEGRDSSAPVNLYRYQPASATAPAQTSYVATTSTNVSSQDLCTFELGVAPCDQENWYTTPDGRYLLFFSEDTLSANAQVGGVCQVPGSQGQPGVCGALYRYDARAAQAHEQPIVCVSCDPGGGVPTGDAEFTRSAGFASKSGPRAMSDDGSYAFFDTPTPLVPQATNHTLDTYEWHNGAISLLSSGSEPGASYFLGYSPYEYTPAGSKTRVKVEGGNVFIGTHDKLVPQDTNSVGNIYDARVCEPESPCIKPPAGETAQCLGDTCQTPPAAPNEPPTTLLAAPLVGAVTPPPPPKSKPLTNAQKLPAALKACHKRYPHSRNKRAACERAAHKKYPVKTAKKSSTAGRATTDRRAK
jgi:hypothetical protein